MQSYVQSKVRDIVDFPKKGIVFRDITTAVKDPKALKFMIDFLTEQFEDKKLIMLQVLNQEALCLALLLLTTSVQVLSW